jgi:hypothetical protein
VFQYTGPSLKEFSQQLSGSTSMYLFDCSGDFHNLGGHYMDPLACAGQQGLLFKCELQDRFLGLL